MAHAESMFSAMQYRRMLVKRNIRFDKRETMKKLEYYKSIFDDDADLDLEDWSKKDTPRIRDLRKQKKQFFRSYDLTSLYLQSKFGYEISDDVAEKFLPIK